MIGKCKINFIKPEDCSRAQRASVKTYQLLFSIPLNERYCVAPELFNQAISEDICDSPGFGKD